MEKKRVARKKGIGFIFALLAIGFTLISALNGLYFYRIIFGLQMAVLIISVFEISRLASLFRIVNTRLKGRHISIIIYALVASVCAFGSINSFASKVIKHNFVEDYEIQGQIQRIKQAYSDRTEEQLTTLNRDVNYIENMISKYPDNDYWKRRLSQIVSNRDSAMLERDNFISLNPESPEDWIKTNSALLGLELDIASAESEEIRSVVVALKEIWNLNKITAQKIVGIIVTITVELSILLLALLSKSEEIQSVTTKKYNRIKREKERSITEEQKIEKLILLNKEYFKKTGRLLPLRKINPNLRSAAKKLKDLDKKSLKSLFLEDKSKNDLF